MEQTLRVFNEFDGASFVKDAKTGEKINVKKHPFEKMIIENNNGSKEYYSEMKGLDKRVFLYSDEIGFSKAIMPNKCLEGCSCGAESKDEGNFTQVESISEAIDKFVKETKSHIEEYEREEANSREEEEEEESTYTITESELELLMSGKIRISDLFVKEETISLEEAQIILGKKIV